MNLTTAITLIAIAFALGGYGGSQWNERNHIKAEVKVLQSDAKVLPVIEAKDNERKERIVTIIKTIREESKPTDCLNQPMPRNVLDSLRSNGS